MILTIEFNDVLDLRRQLTNVGFLHGLEVTTKDPDQMEFPLVAPVRKKSKKTPTAAVEANASVEEMGDETQIAAPAEVNLTATMTEVRQAATDLNTACGILAVTNAVSKFGAPSIGKLKQEDYLPFIQTCAALMQEKAAA